jgi:hypothetical protein
MSSPAFRTAPPATYTADYSFTGSDGSFTGNTFTPGFNDSGEGQQRQATITATKPGASPLNKTVTITDTSLHAGVLVVDLFNNSALDVIALISNAEVSGNHTPAYTGNNMVPASSVTTDALILASDPIAQPVLNWRFEFNIARLLRLYPASGQFIFPVKGRGATAGSVSGAFVLKTFASQIGLDGSPGSYIPVVTGGSNFGQTVNFSTDISGGADGSHAEADLPAMIELTYHVASATVTYTTNTGQVDIPDFDFMTVRYHWNDGAGSDLDILVGFENNQTPYDGTYVGFGQPNPTVPQDAAPQAGAYLWWGSDNNSASGYEGVLIGMKKFADDFPASPDEIEVGLYAVWYGTPLTGDFTVELVTYKGGTMGLSGTEFTNSGGAQVSAHTINANTQISNHLHTPGNAYKVGSVKYTKSTQSATIQIQST